MSAVDLTGKVVAITGGASGIGAAMARRFAGLGAKVALCDVQRDKVIGLARELGGFGWACDIGTEAGVVDFINRAMRVLGPIECYVSNAGLGVTDGPGWGAGDAPNDAWDTCWRVNVMASVWAARHVIPGMEKRGGGTFVVTASAAGFLTTVGDTPYACTKHAAVSFAENVAIAHGDQGIRVHCLCPEGVNTPLIKGIEHGLQGLSGYIEPEDAVEALLAAMADGRFRVFTHPKTAEFAMARIAEPDRWLGGMRKLRRGMVEVHGRPL
jgi:NAD(P)-dependent dehydrogenase (short-subunit alcohol dehydrogenase family)